MSVEEVVEELEEQDKRRLKMLSEQLQKGCGICSQFDDYYGCDRCTR